MAMTRNQRRAAKKQQDLREAIKLSQKQAQADRLAYKAKCAANGISEPNGRTGKGLGNRGIYSGAWPSLGCSGAHKPIASERNKPLPCKNADGTIVTKTKL